LVPTSNTALKKTIKILFTWVIGPLLACWLFYSLYKQVKAQPDLPRAIELMRQAPVGPQAWKFWLVVLLSFANWGIEARKWQVLLKVVQPMGFWRALRSVLCGVTVSLNTPNRMGEYGGRILYIDDGNRLKAVSLSIAGGIAQLIVTIVMGCGGLLYLLNQMHPETGSIFGLSTFWVKIMLYLSFCGAFLLLLFYFRMSWLIKLVEKLPYSHKFSHYISVLEDFNANILLKMLFLSAARYIVFVIQYIFMLQLMQVNASAWQSWWIVTVMFWMLAIVPTFAIADLPIRGQISKSLFSMVSSNALGILAVTFGIWFINLFIPAVAGSLLILGNKFFKQR
jgi:Lysylphosphatidylglycerol synthase TM region